MKRFLPLFLVPCIKPLGSGPDRENLYAANPRNRNSIYYAKESDNDPYQSEHDELFEAIAKGEYKFADAENGAKSTMTAILEGWLHTLVKWSNLTRP